ncbi:RNase J family beta-CASP ribonuclease [Candidatus Woesearchaeota archaeon]|nr:RNase J family beta-CASP ribonuclease [Candidatus Woesearchaeota archaeon]USN44054.1 MAG: RNase J family beta-CASP ribonuclease [Candidatus Woesearchaeota archaeon]
MKFYTLGGCDEAGRNMMAFEIGEEIIICDMGLQLSNLVLYNDAVDSMSLDEMIEKNIVADPKQIMDKKDKVKAIVVSHAHLDHVGAVQYMASLFNCPIYGTPFTIEVLKVLMKSARSVKEPLRNKFIKVNVNSSFTLPSGIEVEFVNVTHSIPQAAMIAMHTPEGVILYANDFKFDNRPALGQRTNYDRLKELNEEGIKLLVVDSVRSNLKRKTLSEIVVKEMLRDVFIETDIVNTQAVLITTFASHITRLKSIMELTAELNRKLVFLGRSISKYCKAARNAGIIDFKEKGVVIAESPSEVNKWLDMVNKNKKEYIVVCTGHQGEPNAVLSRIAEGRTPFELKEDDKVIFSSEVIPTQVNIEARQILDAKLETFRCKIFKDIHVSGHASREDHRDLLNMIKPQNICPVHGHVRLKEGMIELAEEFGYKRGENLWVLPDHEVKEF